MNKITVVLFDFDGVIANTEPLYDEYMNDVEKRYKLGIENFAAKIKGTPTPDIIKRYFSHLNKKDLLEFENEMLEFELNMDFPPIAGALQFIQYLKDNNYKIALVTSSQQAKMTRALKLLNLSNEFDSIVTADRITKGKPHPMCFELAVKDLGVEANECIIFEDSIHGINAGNSANIRVVGLTTSFPEEKLINKVYATLPNFANLEEVKKLLV